MKLLFVNYWGYHEGLTQGTSIPHLHLLTSFSQVEHIWFSTMEREQTIAPQNIHARITHIPLSTAHGLRAKWDDFSKIPNQLARLVRQEKIDLIICRSAPAGALGYLVHRKTQVPYVVESFEPHADYMLESKVWSRWDPRYVLEKFWEARQKKTAAALLPVAEGYRKQLIKEGVSPDRIFTQPCAVPSDRFWFRPENQQTLRTKLGLPESTRIGIYVGKFGGLYLEEEAFRLFQEAFSHFGNDFFLVLLSPNPEEEVKQYISQFQLPADRILHTLAAHSEVPDYLHGADFAFATYKPSPTKRYLSPIKVGEYWASGLPVMITRGVGDETEIIPQQGGGVLIDPEQPNPDNWRALQECLVQPKEKYVALAQEHRSLARNQAVYQQLLEGSSKKEG